MSLNDYSGDGGGREVEQTLLRNVLKVVADKRATYPSEVAKFIDGDHKEAGRVLRELEDAGVLEKLNPKMKHSDERLLDRRAEFWRKNVYGKDGFANMSWYGLNSDREWHLWDNNREVYVDEYHNVLDDGGDYEKNLLDDAVDLMNGEGAV